MNHRQSYLARINRVFDHIDAHLAGPLDLETLAGVANFSPWHFHRVFHAVTGETLADRVRRRRVEAAARLLLGEPPVKVTVVAMQTGFASTEVFSRAFKAWFGVTPTAWRRGAHREWTSRNREALGKIHQSLRKNRQDCGPVPAYDAHDRPNGLREHSAGEHMKVELQTLPDVHVAYMRFVGPYGDPRISQLWERLNAWGYRHGLMPQQRRMYGISVDSPDLTAPGQCRYDACVQVDAGFKPQGEVGVQLIPGGRYACTGFHGTPAQIHQAWMDFCGGWLPASGYQFDDRPLFEAYAQDFAIEPASGAFRCMLCAPVRAL